MRTSHRRIKALVPMRLSQATVRLVRACHSFSLLEGRMMSIARTVRRFVHDDEAATMPEYALMVALIAVVCIVAVGLVGTQANLKFQAIANALQAAA